MKILPTLRRNFAKYGAPVLLSLLSAAFIADAQIVNPSQPATGVPVAGTGISVTGQTVSVNYGVANSPFTGNMSVGGTFSATGAVSGTGFSNLFASPFAIGSTAANTGAFTNLSASGTLTGAGFSNLFSSPPPIGSTAANTGAFSTLGATGTVTASGNISVGGQITSPTTVPVINTNIASFLQTGTGATSRTAAAEFTDTVKPEQFGAVGDDVHDDGPALIAALATFKDVVGVSGHKYKIGAGSLLTIDVYKQSLRCNGATLDFAALTGTQQGIHVINTGSTPSDINPAGARNEITGCEILGPGIGSTATAIYFTGPHAVLRDDHIYNFGVGMDYFSGAYNIKSYSVNIGQCGIGVRGLSGGSVYGEQITYFGSTIYDNNLAVSNNMANGTLAFIGGHFDYNLEALVSTNSAVTSYHEVWFEANDAGAGKVHFDLSGASTVEWVAGRITEAGTPGALAQSGVIKTDATSMWNMRQAFMFNTQNTVGRFDAGVGITDIDATTGYQTSYYPTKVSAGNPNNRLADGGFEAASFIDYWAITADSGAITNRLTGVNTQITLSSVLPHSGAQSLLWTKVGGGAGDFTVYVPIRPGSLQAFECYVKTTGSGAGVFISNIVYRIEGTASNGVPNIVNAQAFDIVQTATTQGYTLYQSSRIRAPSWATHYGIKFSGNAFTGTMNVDDCYLSGM